MRRESRRVSRSFAPVSMGRPVFRSDKNRSLRFPKRQFCSSGQLVSVFIVDSSNILHLRLIKTGKQYGDQLEVLSGLNDGDRIVVEGMERVKEGDRVQ